MVKVLLLSVGRWLRALRRPRWSSTLFILALLAFALHASSASAQGCGPGVEDGRSVNLGTETCVQRLSDGDDHSRTFHFMLPDEPRGYRLVATADAPEPLRLCLIVAGGESCRASSSPLVVSDLVLSGELSLRLLRVGWPVGTRYQFSVEPAPLPAAEREVEPNDVVALAHPLGRDLAVRGSLGGGDRDVYLVDISGEAQLWRVQVVGAGVERLALLDVRGKTLQSRDMERGGNSIRLSNVYLVPGSHWLEVTGSSGDYALRLLPLGPPEDASLAPAPSAAPTAPPMVVAESALTAAIPVERPSGPRPAGRMEREPNDDASRAQLLVPGEPMVGLLAEREDFDFYRIAMPVEGYARLSVTSPPEGSIRVDVAGGRGEARGGEPYRFEGRWLAGDHLVTLRPTAVSEGYYQVHFEMLDPFLLPDDLEPNNRPDQARPLPLDLRVVGEVGQHGDDDVFLLPVFEQETDVRFLLEGAGVSLHSIRDRFDDWVAAVELDRGSSEGRARVPAGGPYALRLSGRGVYNVTVVIDGMPELVRPRVAPPEVELSIEGGTQLAAFLNAAQRLTLEVVVRNRSAQPLELELEAAMGASEWTAHFADPTPTLAPGESRRVPLLLEAAPWVRDDLPIAVHVAARARGGGEAVTARHDLLALCGAPPLAPLRRWPIPEPFLGGFDVAAVALGAVPQSDVRRELLLYDGRVQPGDGWRAELGSSSTVALAGEEPPRLLGVLLHPLSDTPVAERARDFRIWTSLDGALFELALEGRLSSEGREQGFLFPQPRAARYARIEVLSRQDGRLRGAFGLGTFKVIAEPGTPPVPGLLDIGNPTLGGHVVDAEPFLRPLAFAGTQSRPETFRYRGGAVHWIIGFLHGRAGLVHSLAWRAAPNGDLQQAIPEVTVSVASDSPLGPWFELGSWRPGELPVWELPTPVWARYVRFDAVGMDSTQMYYEFPLSVGILEQPAAADYRSLVGEWGYAKREAVWEWLHPSEVDEVVLGGDNGSRDTALLVPEGGVVVSSVAVGAHEAWFAVDVPAGANFLELTLSGDPAPRYRWRLLDATGAEVAADVSGSGNELVIAASLPPGRYHLHTWEPPRSVVFSWDDSGSMGPYVDISYQAVASFVRGLNPLTEVVQLQAFGDQPRFLLPDWTSDPEQVIATLSRYPRDQDSSAAELNLGFVVEQLAEREGTRAIILITDAGGVFQSGGGGDSRQLWDALAAVQPQIFSFHTDSGGTFVNEARMQDWAYSAAGAYDYTRTMADFDTGLAGVRCSLRQPKLVQVAARTDNREPPGPGALRAVLADAEASTPAVMVVLDASGSMGKLLPGSRLSRWEAAQAVVQRLLAEQLPDDVQFGLRVYGHVTPGACTTELVLPPAPLNRARARSLVAALEPKLFSGTPLGASIEALISDLANLRTATQVVLITDGEESCGADPEAAMVALRAAHPDARVSIVGFDVDAEDRAAARRRFERWAEIGGGRYLEAGDATALEAALAEGLAPVRRFEVLSADGQIVAEGEIGGAALPLVAGRYLVRMKGAEATREIRVPAEREVTVTLSVP